MAAQALLPVISAAASSPVRSLSEKRLCSLWAGYGSVSQLTAVCKNGKETFIVKRVQPPEGAGVSHERKVQSYRVEESFYLTLAKQVLAAGGRIPLPLHIATEKGSHTFVLTDLQGQYPLRLSSYSLQQARVAVEWLALFHAVFWEQPLPPGVWESGCYWHLQTRLEELDQISGEWLELKALAPLLDAAIRCPAGTSRRHRTLVHGDFKSENILFDRSSAACAAYDFQYCGEGLGARDLAYLFASSVDQAVVRQHETALLDHYHACLCQHVRGLHGVEASYSREQLLLDYELCLADYLRFLAGWGWWGNVSWLKQRVRDMLPRLREHVQRQHAAP